MQLKLPNSTFYRYTSNTFIFLLFVLRRDSTGKVDELVCSGHGNCVCGVCELCDCLPGTADKNKCTRYTGTYCQCNPDKCPRDRRGICSGM